MAKTDLSIQSLGNKFVDLRDSMPGDSYNWSWVRPLLQVNYLAIHHTAGPDTQGPSEIANFHINSNGWGGIGYHFLIAKDGTVFYVGDISTARANVANLNEQVLGICLVGNFTQGEVPTNEQIDSTHKLCEFFISNYPALSNVTSWDKVRGHKELPGQATICPGDDWSTWRIRIVEGVSPAPSQPISEDSSNLQSQVDSLQASLAVVNQQVISLSETLAKREQEISQLKAALAEEPQPPPVSPAILPDNTLTIIEALINLYKFVFQPRKES